MNNDEVFVKTYIGRFEQALLDHVRKQVDSETRVVIYEGAIQDLQRKLEESERSGSDYKSAFDQAVSGLHAVTSEKDDLKAKHEQREMEFELICAEMEKLRSEKLAAENRESLLRQQLFEVEQKLNGAQLDNVTLKNNYDIVLMNLEEANAEVERLRLYKKTKKVTPKDSEWIDGDEISG